MVRGRVVEYPTTYPKTFVLRQKVSVTSSYIIEDSVGSMVASAKGELFALAKRNIFYDCNGIYLGKVKQKLLALRTTYRIYDKQDKLIATLTGKIIQVPYSEYWVKDLNDNTLLYVKSSLLKWDYKIFDGVERVIGEITKASIFPDKYEIKIYTNVDQYLVFATSVIIDRCEHEYRGKGVWV